MALLTVVTMTGCGATEEQQSRHPAVQQKLLGGEDAGLRGRTAPLRGVLAAGGAHSLALDADGTLWAWGHNAVGQLGDGTTRNRSQPVKAVGLGKVKAVEAGPGHSLALAEDGTVWAWGANDYGQLGQDPYGTMSNPTPTQVPGLTGVVAVATGEGHSLALRADGTVWAWGANSDGQLGQPVSYEPNPMPAQVPDLTDVVAIAADRLHTLALRADGTVWAWGNNSRGELGRPPNFEPNPTPAQVPELTGAVAISAGLTHALALRSDGTVWAWGDNSSGERGQPPYDELTSSPTQVPGLTDVVAVAAGSSFSLALRADGTVSAWGFNALFQLGDGTRLDRYTPQQVPGLKHVIALAADQNPLALSKNGTLWAWGDNAYGQLGTGTELRTTPVQVLGLGDAKLVSTSGLHVLALHEDGSVWGWGETSSGRIGEATDILQATPKQMMNLPEAVDVSAGYSHSLALREDGTVWGWGANLRGQLGRPANYSANPIPAQVPGLTGIVSVRAVGFSSLALRADGTVWAWGGNSYGQLGRPANYSANPIPAQVPGLTEVVALESSGEYVLALRADGTVWSWGFNSAGQLGRPYTYVDPTPKPVPGLTEVVALSAAFEHALALRADGTVWAWGRNAQGQLGDGTRRTRYTPAPVPGLTGVKGIAAATASSLVVRQDGTVWGFGSNDYNLLSATDESLYLSPVQRPELTGVKALATNGTTGMALREDGTLLAWGSNRYDQIGDGVSSQHSTPSRTLLPCRFTGMASREHRASEAEHCPATH
jgi:alpha-tubulin suppressor-like RCC1 family protein